MANKKTTKKSKRSEKPGRKALLVIIVAAVIILFAGWYFSRNTSLSTPNKEDVRAQVQAGLDASKFQGNVVYSSIEDLGCDDRNSVGLALYIHCDFLGQKYFKASGSLDEHLKSSGKVLSNAGWQSHGDYEEFLADKGMLTYEKPGSVIALYFFKDNKTKNGFDLQNLARSGKIGTLKEGEFLYGVHIGAGYWSCHWDSFFTQPCPAPPSKPHF